MATGGTKSHKMVSYAKYGYLFILPFFLVYAFFMIWPLINTILLSFKGNSTVAGASVEDWVGFQNYKWILFGDSSSAFSSGQLQHEDFFTTFGNTLILWIGNFIIQIILSLLLAVWFSDVRIKVKGTGFFKVVMYMPNIIMAASVAAIFLMFFDNSKYGIINSLFINNGWSVDPVDFLNNKWSIRLIVMFVQSWLWFGNTMLLLLSGIFGIDPSIYEAASIDGSSGANTFFRITMPILKPIFLYVVITSLIGGLQMFDIPYLMHKGDSPIKHIRTAAVYIYERFHKGSPPDYGYSAAASIILFIVTLILGLIVMRFNNDSTAPKKRKK
ncbi:MAG: sugar ABC transporter permease [Oscillospiraceae bacterium]|nr:sugar ABC transporter permease [Oscillospiraceae bacterium]